MPKLAVANVLSLAVFGLAAGIAPATVSAQGLVTTHRISAAVASELVAGAVAACKEQTYNVTAVVLDIDGVRQAMDEWGFVSSKDARRRKSASNSRSRVTRPRSSRPLKSPLPDFPVTRNSRPRTNRSRPGPLEVFCGTERCYGAGGEEMAPSS